MRCVGWLIMALLGAPALAETRALVAAGLGGEPDYESEFQRQAQASAAELRKVASDVTVLLGEAATRERLRDELEALAARSGGDDAVVVLLIGHGSYDDRDYRFNLPGADVTGEELARWLEVLPATRQLVVAATSSSGALQPLLTEAPRMVITATRSGGERNVTVFPRYFAAALADAAADTDKDGYVSVVEAFRFAEAAVTAHYYERNQMATEHPTLGGPEMTLALARIDAIPAFDPGSGVERDRLEVLEAEIVALRADKASREADDYYAELQRLLLEIAMLRRRLGEERSP